MPTTRQIFRHRLGGGWGPDFGPTADVNVAPQIIVPWLMNADNIEYLLDGGYQKVGGTSKLNSTVLESGAEIHGLFDYWKMGSTGSPVQKRIVHVGTKIKKDDADGSFSDIFTGMTDGAVPAYAVYDDAAIIMSDAIADVPKFWDQSTAKDLGTNTPNCAFGVTHKNRFWMAGDVANPSSLYYSQALPNGADGDWNGAGAGQIEVGGTGSDGINAGDGDRITGLVSHKDSLFVFKGPYKGSIHRITGSAPADFDIKVFVEGLGSVNHNTIFKYRDDVGFMWSDGSIHSLNATSAFGDFLSGSLSLPFNIWMRDHGNHDLFRYASSATVVSNSTVYITFPIDTSPTNNAMLSMDYRFIGLEGAPRWAKMDYVGAACVATVIDSASDNTPSLFTGGNDGFVRRMLRPDRSIDGATAYTAKATQPFLHYGTPMQMKTLGNGAVGMSPKGDYDLVFAWTRDDKAQQTQNVSQAGSGDTLAPSTNQFTLGTSSLGGSTYVDRFMDIEQGGEFRDLQLEVQQGGVNQAMEVHSLTVEIAGDSLSTEN